MKFCPHTACRAASIARVRHRPSAIAGAR
jgi:hypothetical protein